MEGGSQGGNYVLIYYLDVRPPIAGIDNKATINFTNVNATGKSDNISQTI